MHKQLTTHPLPIPQNLYSLTHVTRQIASKSLVTRFSLPPFRPNRRTPSLQIHGTWAFGTQRRDNSFCRNIARGSVVGYVLYKKKKITKCMILLNLRLIDLRVMWVALSMARYMGCQHYGKEISEALQICFVLFQWRFFIFYSVLWFFNRSVIVKFSFVWDNYLIFYVLIFKKKGIFFLFLIF